MHNAGEEHRLSATQLLITEENDQIYEVMHGTLHVFIAQFDADKLIDKEFLCEVNAGEFIPTLVYEDEDHRVWRMAIQSKEGDATYRVLAVKATSVTKRAFLKKIAPEAATMQDFADALIEYYNKKQLKAEIRKARKKRNQGKANDQAGKIMRKALDNPITIEEGTANFRAVAYACRFLHHSMPSDLQQQCGHEATIPHIAQSAGVICRAVVLDENWYHHDCGVIISRMDGHSVTLVPWKRSQYRLYDGEIQKTETVTEKIAAQIDPAAYSIGRTLPEHSLTRKDILRFVRNGFSSSDVLGAAVLGLLCTLIGLLLPELNQKVYDEYIQIGDANMLMQMCSVIGTFMVGNIFIQLVKGLCEFRLSSRCCQDVQNALYHRFFRLPESFLRHFDSGDMAQRLMGGGEVAQSLCTSVISITLSCAYGLIFFIQMLTYSWRLSLAALGMLTVAGIVMYCTSVCTIQRRKRMMEYDAQATSKLHQYINAVDKLRMAGAEDHALLEFVRTFGKQVEEEIRINRLSAMSEELRPLFSTVFSMIFYLMLVHLDDKTTMGKFMAFQTAFGSVSGTVLGMVNAYLQYLAQKPQVERIAPLLQQPEEQQAEKEIVKKLKGNIELKHVSFSYTDGGTPVLNDISLNIHPGEYVGIVGASGCGKSTLFKLLLGFEKPTAGSVLYDGKELDMLEKRSFRRRLGVVLQNGRLIAGSIFENITITSEKPDAKAVLRVLESVGLKKDVDAMPMRIHTILSESGGTISGGQQQRILIARAIYNQPDILFLDEATSALDNLTQAKVCQSLGGMGMTRVVIAHRLSTIQNCDRILVMEHGDIAEEGTFDELMARKGLFYQMASRQIA